MTGMQPVTWKSGTTRMKQGARPVLLDGVRIGTGAVVRDAILDKNVEVGAGVRIGVDPAADRARFTVSRGGVVVIGKGQSIAV